MRELAPRIHQTTKLRFAR
jgi:hypothetical protein